MESYMFISTKTKEKNMFLQEPFLFSLPPHFVDILRTATNIILLRPL